MKLDCHTVLRAPFRFMIKASKVLTWRRQSRFEHNTGRHRPLGVKLSGKLRQISHFASGPSEYFHYCAEEKTTGKADLKLGP